MKESEILLIMSRKLSPFMFLFGFYLISQGHISPGGGFQGGVVLGSSIILLCLCHGLKATEETLKGAVGERLEYLLIIMLVPLALAGVTAIRFVLSKFFGHGSVSGTMLLIDAVIGLKVGACMTTLFYRMARPSERV